MQNLPDTCAAVEIAFRVVEPDIKLRNKSNRRNVGHPLPRTRTASQVHLRNGCPKKTWFGTYKALNTLVLISLVLIVPISLNAEKPMGEAIRIAVPATHQRKDETKAKKTSIQSKTNE